MPKRKIEGIVVSDKMEKTIVIRVETRIADKMFQKKVKKMKKYKVHDENNICKVGDKIEAEESRPLSRDKHWVLKRIIKENIYKEQIPSQAEGGAHV